MGIFNQHSNNQPHQQSFLRGLRGSPGVGFSLTSDGNYDMNNKKLKNVGEGVESSDAVTKHQLETAINSSPSLNNFVKKDSPEVAADLDMKGYGIKNMKVTPADDASATSRKYVDGKLNTKADKSILSQYIKRDGSVQMVGNLQMNGKRITGLSNVPYYNGEAANKRYVDDKVNAKADKSDLNNKADKSDLDDYLKLDGTTPMQGGLNMNNKRITRLPDPQLADEPVTRKFLTSTNTLFYNIFLDLDGNSKMRGNLQMNDKRVTGLTNPPNADDEATNKKYVDENMSKANIKPSHTPKNVFQYLMDDVNEWSSEYGVKVESFSDLAESPHSWDKRVLNITPVKSGRNYRFRLGLQMFRTKTNESYSLIVELYNRDYKTWQRQQTYVNGTGMWVISNNTAKYQHQYGSSGDLYYSKTLIKFKKTSSTAPIFVYFTVHFDDNGGDMNTYPKDFKNQVYIIAYGIEGLTDHVDSEVYDAHEAFEIDKTKMKMLVPLDMNGKQLMNVNYELKFGDIFKLIKCYVKPLAQQNLSVLLKKSDQQILSVSIPVVIHSIILFYRQNFNNNSYISFNPGGIGFARRTISLANLPSQTGNTKFCIDLPMMCIFTKGLRNISFFNIGKSQFDADIVVTYM